ncbi:MAG: epoxyqueuosine reductase QueH, partial [Clostridia bacterium]|nr:epoxyqueuosine reductase QueH [Clostridia bacterium]
FNITVLFYNPNIENAEYEKRKAEIIRFLNETGWADFMDCDHNPEDFYTACKGLEGEKEGGARCLKCFEVRLKKTAELAKDYDYFTTTLTISPLKDAAAINNIGENLGGEKWLFSDFKKRGGYLRSSELSKEHNLYRQNYCGCVFSRLAREKG